jgi:hypothetical protein
MDSMVDAGMAWMRESGRLTDPYQIEWSTLRIPPAAATDAEVAGTWVTTSNSTSSPTIRVSQRNTGKTYQLWNGETLEVMDEKEGLGAYLKSIKWDS